MKKLATTIIIACFIALQLSAQNNQAVKDDPKGAWEFERMRTADPITGEIPYEKYEKARKQAREQILRQRAQGKGPQDFGNWTERGPNNFGGRTRAIMWDPSNESDDHKVWAGGVNGGLWVNEDITDPNSEWELNISFNEVFSISSITYDPQDTEIIYVGTGEYWTNEVEELNNPFSPGAKGNGVYKSINGGQDWTCIGSGVGVDCFYYVNDLICRNGDIYVCTPSGLFKYSSRTWSLVESGSFSSIKLIPNNRLLTAITGENSDLIIIEEDDMALPLNVEISGNAPYCTRIVLSANPNSNTIYLLGSQGQTVVHIKRSDDLGQNWTTCNIPQYMDPKEGCTETIDFSRKQGRYNLTICANPILPNTVCVGGVDIYTSFNGGMDWEKISDWSGDCQGEYLHADQHQFIPNPNNNDQILIGNDGGVYISNDLFTSQTPSFESRNKNYNVTQFYTCYTSNSSETILGGTQDNGSIRMDGVGLVEGIEVNDGDGGFCFIDKESNNVKITSVYYSKFSRALIGNIYTKFNIDENKGLFINPSDYDDNNNILYLYYGTPNENKLDYGDSIMRIKGVITPTSNKHVLELNNSGGVNQVDFMRVSPISQTLYLSIVDKLQQNVRVFSIDNPNTDSYIVNELDSQDLPDKGHIGCISFGSNEDDIIVTYSNYSNGSDNIFQREDGEWVPKQGNLDDFPIHWAEFNPNNRDQVLLATEVGLYKTNDISQDEPYWEIVQFSPNSDPSLSIVRCEMIRIRHSDKKVFVATHGRGIWESDIFMDGTPVPDIVISSVNPIIPTAELNETITVDVTVSNIGNVTAAYNTSQCFISDDNILDDSDLFLFQESLGAIVNGQYIIANGWELQIPGSIGTGNKYIIYKADGLEEVDEGSHENNNTLAVPITIYPAASGGSGPDMTVLNEFVSKRVIEQGQSFSVNCDVMNQGDEDATGGWKQKWYLSDNQTYSEDDLQLDFLQWAFLWSDSTSYIHREMTMPTSVADGEYYILIYIDSDHELTETDEYNNTKILSITVGTIPVPSLYAPMDDEEEVSFTPTFYWEDLGNDVDTYDFAIYDYVTQNGNTYLQQVYYQSGLTEPEWQVTSFNFDYDEGYKWTARSRVDGTHGEWATLFSFHTKHYLNKPVLYDPNNYITNEPLNPTFTWSNVDNASQYRLKIAEDEDFNNEIEDWSGLTNNWFIANSNNLDTATTYYWKVRAYAGAGNSDYSQVFQFRTGGDVVPGIPNNQYPAHDSTEVSLTPQLVWETGNGVSLSYQIDISADSIFDSIVFSQNNIPLTNYFVPNGYLNGLSKYYWRVRAWNGAGFSQYSDSSSFTTKTAGGPGTVKWFAELGNVEGTPVFDSEGYIWCDVDDAVVKINPKTGDTLFTLVNNYAEQEFGEGLTLSHNGNIVYTVAHDDDLFSYGETNFIVALDLDGNILWYYDTYCWNVSKPALDAAGNLYVNLSQGEYSYQGESSVISLDPNGNLRWRGLISDDDVQFTSCPVVKGNKVYVGREKIDDVGSVFALNTSNGSVVWQRTLSDDEMSNNIPGISNIGLTFNSRNNEYLYYVNSTSGSNLSGWPFTNAIDSFEAATVIDENGVLFNGTDDFEGSTYAMALNSNGSVKWQNQIFYDYTGSSVLANNGIIYYGSRDLILYAVDKATGNELWSQNIIENFYEMAIGPDGTLFIAMDDGLLAIETTATGLNTGYWPVKVHDYQGTNCYDHVDIIYTPTIVDFSIKNNQDTTRTINNTFNYEHLNIATHYKISEDSLFTNNEWIEIDSNYSFQITTGYEEKTAYFVMKNDNGNSDTLSDIIDYVSSAPIVFTDSITNLNISNVKLLGKVNSNILNTQYFMEFGTSTSYGIYSDTSSLISGTEEISVNVYIEGLLPATQYHYRIVAVNSGGTTYGNDKTFTTHDLFVPVSLWAEVLGYQANLSWSAPELECYSCSILGYNVYRNSTLVNPQLLTTLSYADSGLVNGIYNYAVTAVYQEGESILSDISTIEIAGGGFPDGWDYIRTQNPHVIVIPIETPPAVDGNVVSKGDYLGVFYQRGNSEVCGGAARWGGINSVSLIAYGDDTLSAVKDGFIEGESIIWKIKSWDIGSFAEAVPSYDNSFPNSDGKQYCFGLSGLLGLSGTSSPPENIDIQNITIGNGETECYDATDIITVAGSGTTVTINPGGEATFIAGEKIYFKPGFQAYNGSAAYAYITLSGDYCSNQQSMLANTDTLGIGEITVVELFDKYNNIKIYPNPTTGNFTIDFKGKETTADITVLNFQGNKIRSLKCNNQVQAEVDISYLPAGMYILIIKTGSGIIKKKVTMLK